MNKMMAIIASLSNETVDGQMSNNHTLILILFQWSNSIALYYSSKNKAFNLVCIGQKCSVIIVRRPLFSRRTVDIGPFALLCAILVWRASGFIAVDERGPHFLASSQTVPRPLSTIDTHPQARIGTFET